MKKKLLKVSFILFCVLMSCTLFGCKKESIKFYRESSVQNIMHGIQNQNNKDEIKKSSGMIIYKDNSSNSQTHSPSVTHFGPKDINFDLPIK